MRSTETGRKRSLAACLVFALAMAAWPVAAAQPIMADKHPGNRPWMFVTGEKIQGLRSLEEVRAGIQQGHAARLWQPRQTESPTRPW